MTNNAFKVKKKKERKKQVYDSILNRFIRKIEKSLLHEGQKRVSVMASF